MIQNVEMVEQNLLSQSTCSHQAQLGYYKYWPDTQQVPYYYPQVLGGFSIMSTSKTDTAFKIIKNLMAMKIIKDLTIEDFVKLVDDISKEL